MKSGRKKVAQQETKEQDEDGDVLQDGTLEESVSVDEDEHTEEIEDEEDDQNIDELIFLEAVASLNENISMVTMNSSEIFNSFQKMIEETQNLSDIMGQVSTQISELSQVQEQAMEALNS